MELSGSGGSSCFLNSYSIINKDFFFCLQEDSHESLIVFKILIWIFTKVCYPGVVECNFAVAPAELTSMLVPVGFVPWWTEADAMLPSSLHSDKPGTYVDAL